MSFNGRPIERLSLPDDPADARGVLSHLAGVEPGSHGELVDGLVTLNDSDRARLAAGQPLIIRLAVPNDAPQAGGLCLFGARYRGTAPRPDSRNPYARSLAGRSGSRPRYRDRPPPGP